MQHLLNNPVYYAMLTGDASLGFGKDNVKVFHEEVSPFVGEENNKQGFIALYNMLPPGRKILYATRDSIAEPVGWELTNHIEGLQFLLTDISMESDKYQNIVPLNEKNVEEMIELARLTKPGPFDKRTIEFGHYYGIFENNRLAAMTGQRLHVYNYTEISAVCTHPNYLGNGYAAALLRHQLNIIVTEKQIPFLHVRADNERAIALYERLGFTKNGTMNFYFLRRKS